MTPMKLISSSMLQAYAYEPAERVFVVRYNNSDMLHPHVDVPPEVVAEFEAAESKGKFFNAHIKAKYPTSGPHPMDDTITKTADA